VVKLAYAQFNQLTSGANLFANQIYRGNSIFDPDLTGVGHQALGHDQWATLYEAYRVLSSTITVTATSQDTAEPLLLVVVPTEEGSIIDSGNPDTYCESPNARHRYLAVRVGMDSSTINHSMTTAQMLGIRRLDSGFDEAALFGSNPSSNASWYWHVYCGVRSGTPNLEVHVKITYTVEMLKRKQLTSS